MNDIRNGFADNYRSPKTAGMAPVWIFFGGAMAAMILMASAMLSGYVRFEEGVIATQMAAAAGLFVCLIFMVSIRSTVSRSVGWNWATAVWSVVASSLLVLVISWRGLVPLSASLAVYVLFALSFSGSLMVGAASIRASNQRTVNSVAAADAERMRRSRFADDRERRLGKEISDRLHGPVHGRLSACVMALSFAQTQAGRATRVGSPLVVDLIVGHLAAAVADLDALKS